MSIDALREQLPAYAKDISLNLSSLAGETILNDQQKWGCFVAAAYAVGQPDVVKAINGAASSLSDDAKTAARAAAAIMGMNNVYYRAMHIMSNHEYRTLPARLRMNIIANPGVDKIERMRHVPGRTRERTTKARAAQHRCPSCTPHRRRGQRRQPGDGGGEGCLLDRLEFQRRTPKGLYEIVLLGRLAGGEELAHPARPRRILWVRGQIPVKRIYRGARLMDQGQPLWQRLDEQIGDNLVVGAAENGARSHAPAPPP
jgi:hypothetical protein